MAIHISKSFGKRRVNSTQKFSRIENPIFHRKSGYTKTRWFRRKSRPTSLYALHLIFSTYNNADLSARPQIKDEYEFLQDFSQHLSQRYQRPTSAIFITLNHSACLLFGGTFDPAYMLAISALPSQLLPTTNKRNAALLQSFMSDSLGVAPARGVIRFTGIPDEDLAFNGTTVLGQIENLQKTSENGNSLGTGFSAFPQKAQSRKQVQTKPRDLPLREGTQSVPISRVASPAMESPPIPAIPTEKSALDIKAEKVQRLGKRRSFMAMFGK